VFRSGTPSSTRGGIDLFEPLVPVGQSGKLLLFRGNHDRVLLSHDSENHATFVEAKTKTCLVRNADSRPVQKPSDVHSGIGN
jgi:hypothetical protein